MDQYISTFRGSECLFLSRDLNTQPAREGTQHHEKTQMYNGAICPTLEEKTQAQQYP
jgi:hypothetical protein